MTIAIVTATDYKIGTITPAITGVSIYRKSTAPDGVSLTITDISSGPPYVDRRFQYGNGSTVDYTPSGSTVGAVLLFDEFGNWILLNVDSSLIPQTTQNSTIVLSANAYDINNEHSLGDAPLSSLEFENLAKKAYDDPILGVLLRQINLVDKKSGEQYIVPSIDEISQELIEPQSHIFLNRVKFLQDIINKENDNG